MASRSQMRLAQITGSLSAPESIGAAHALNAYSAADLKDVLDAMGQAIARIHGEKDFTNKAQGVFTPSKFDVDTTGDITLDGNALNIGLAANVPVDFNAAAFDLDASGAITMDAGAASEIATSLGAITVDGAAGVDLQHGGSSKLEVASAEVTLKADLFPSVDASYDLGQSSERYAEAHIVSGTFHGISVHTMAVSDLTNNRIVIAGTSGELEDDAKFRFDGTAFDIGASENETFKVVVATGATTIQGAIDANSTADIADTLTLSKASGNGLVVTADSDLNGDLDVAGVVNLSAPSTATTVRGTLQVDEAAVFSSNVTIAGNLDINGTVTTIDTANLSVEDTIIALAYNGSGSAAPAGDRGLIMEIDSENSPVMFWDESGDEFSFARTTSANTDVEIVVASYADLHVGALSGSSISTDLAQNHVVYTNASGDLSIDSSVFQYDTANLSVGSAFDVTVSDGKTLVGKLEIDSASDYIDVNTDLQIVASADIELTAGSLKPATNDGVAIGEAGLGFSDLYLALGAVIDFHSSDVTMTHSSNLLSIAGGNTRVERLEVDSANNYIDVVNGDLTAVADADLVLNHAAGGVVRIKDGASAPYGKIEYANSADLALISEAMLFLSSSSGNGIVLDAGDGSIALQKANSDFGTIAVQSGVMYVQSSAELFASGSELRFNDDKRTGSSWTQGYITLSDSTTEWDNYETAFGGEVSLLAAITAAAAGDVNANKYYAEVSAGDATSYAADSDKVPFSAFAESDASTDRSLAAAFGAIYHATDKTHLKRIDVYVNGQLMLEGSGKDYEWDQPGSKIDFSFRIEADDVIQVVIR